jgi:hypothetical protein
VHFAHQRQQGLEAVVELSRSRQSVLNSWSMSGFSSRSNNSQATARQFVLDSYKI